MNKGIELAKILQHSLLPKKPASYFWDMEYDWKPMEEISGDILDCYNFSDTIYGIPDAEQEEHLGLILLDASGHGISAALIGVIARPVIFREHRERKREPLGTVVFNANAELNREMAHTDFFLTGISIRLFADHLEYVNCSHPRIILYRRGKVYALPNSGFFFGIDAPQQPPKTYRMKVKSGDILLLFTDGFSEAKNQYGHEFLDKKLGGLLQEMKPESLPTREILHGLINAKETFSRQQADDTTLIVLRRK